MSPKPLNTAIIGYGLSAKVFHIPFILALPDLFKLYGLVRRHAAPNDEASIAHPCAKVWTTTESMLADPVVDLVVVTAIPDVHYSICKAALEAGKHVVCEKPFTPTSLEAEELAVLAQQNGKILSVYQNRRWDGDFLTVKQLVESGRLGRIAEFETHFDRHRPLPPSATSATWKSKEMPGNGAIYDLGTHLLDQVVHLFGLPSRVTAFLGNQRLYTDPGTEQAGGDSFTVLLHYCQDEQNMLVTAKAGVVSPEAEQLRFWLRGEQGSFKKFHLDPQEDQLKAGHRPGKDSTLGSEPEERYGRLTTKENDTFYAQPVEPPNPPATYLQFYRQLHRAISSKGYNPVPADEAAGVILLIELCKESSETGRTINMKETE